MFSEPGHQFFYKLLSYYIVLFPAIDVISSYPLMSCIISNSLYSLITGHDSSKTSKYKFDWLLKVVLRFIAAVVPIGAAFGVANLILVFKYAGLFGFLNLFSPVLLQLRSIYICKKKFSALESVASDGYSETDPSPESNQGFDVEESRELTSTSNRQGCHHMSLLGHLSRVRGKNEDEDFNSEEGLLWTIPQRREGNEEKTIPDRRERSDQEKVLMEGASHGTSYSKFDEELHLSLLEKAKAKEEGRNGRPSSNSGSRDEIQQSLEEADGRASSNPGKKLQQSVLRKEKTTNRARACFSGFREELHRPLLGGEGGEERAKKVNASRGEELQHMSLADDTAEEREQVLGAGSDRETLQQSPLDIGKDTKMKSSKKQSYMTPYSFVLLSHPVFVCAVGGLGVILFVLAIASLFIQPEDLTCEALAF